MQSAYSFLPQVIAHRGSSGQAPENTLASLHLAGQQGIKWVEIDVMLSGDGIPVIFHDDYLSRTTDGDGLIYKTPLAELKQLDAGSWKGQEYQQETIPTLLEAIEVISQYGMGLNLELKPCEGLEEETIAASVEVLKQHWPQDLPLLFSSFNYFALVSAKALWPEIARGYNVSAIPSAWQERLEHLDCAGLHIHQSFFDVQQVSDIKAAGYKVLAFTINDESLALKLYNQGLDAVFSDYPQKIQSAIDSHIN
ncbi:MAG: glycerophosphoryl diester phosphodiesterase [Oleispira antarctica]|uniref:Glycerophosphoryl diester esterase n=2 Tax=Oleispira antarctica TaxID=188908 RepID=R4YTY7_OLEAN|nr:glycerophosphoryl diester phosphodiesterase [Oleispira antarctica]CCK76209.1 Glycerophosphoryl diester esterase [Oleispira antarctica RB-8]